MDLKHLIVGSHEFVINSLAFRFLKKGHKHMLPEVVAEFLHGSDGFRVHSLCGLGIWLRLQFSWQTKRTRTGRLLLWSPDMA